MSEILHKLFKSNAPFVTYIFKDGTAAQFVGGKYFTGDVNKYNELMEEVQEIGAGRSKHPSFYVDEAEQEIDPDATTPLAILEKQLRAKILLEMEEAGSTSNDRGTSSAQFTDGINNTVSSTPQASSDKGVIAALANLKVAQTAKLAPQVNAVANLIDNNAAGKNALSPVEEASAVSKEEEVAKSAEQLGAEQPAVAPNK